MSSNRKDIICGVVSEIISSEFIDGRLGGVCLPANIIMYDAMKQMDIKAELICGLLTYDGHISTDIHFWTNVDGKIYDPTRRITKFCLEAYQAECNEVDISKFEFHPGKQKLRRPQDEGMMRTYREMRKNCEYIEEYFRGAPNQLKHIRAKINARIKKSIKNM